MIIKRELGLRHKKKEDSQGREPPATHYMLTTSPSYAMRI